MGFFTCQYLEDHGGFLSSEYVCQLTRKRLDPYTVSNVCSTSNYSSCYDYKQKHSFWFIANAAYRALGKEDNPDLAAFTDWKCNYLSRNDEGQSFLTEYMESGPGIVDAINDSDRKMEIYRELYSSYLKPCIDCIRTGAEHEAFQIYQEMFYELKKQYLC